MLRLLWTPLFSRGRGERLIEVLFSAFGADQQLRARVVQGGDPVGGGPLDLFDPLRCGGAFGDQLVLEAGEVVRGAVPELGELGAVRPEFLAELRGGLFSTGGVAFGTLGRELGAVGAPGRRLALFPFCGKLFRELLSELLDLLAGLSSGVLRLCHGVLPGAFDSVGGFPAHSVDLVSGVPADGGDRDLGLVARGGHVGFRGRGRLVGTGHGGVTFAVGGVHGVLGFIRAAGGVECGGLRAALRRQCLPSLPLCADDGGVGFGDPARRLRFDGFHLLLGDARVRQGRQFGDGGSQVLAQLHG